MIPTGGQIPETEVEETIAPSRTWLLDFDKRRVSGMTDELGAIKQAVFKTLQTDRFQHLIYSFDYGHEMMGLLGKSPIFVQSEVNRTIHEALLQDDRIQAVENIQSTVTGDCLLVQFTVLTIFGSFDYSQEVRRGV
jgi:hypothetical protein